MSRKFLSAALSRAMRRLFVLYDNAKPSRFIRELDKNLWS
jgi:superfamily I DNA/RNA helicase